MIIVDPSVILKIQRSSMTDWCPYFFKYFWRPDDRHWGEGVFTILKSTFTSTPLWGTKIGALGWELWQFEKTPHRLTQIATRNLDFRHKYFPAGGQLCHFQVLQSAESSHQAGICVEFVPFQFPALLSLPALPRFYHPIFLFLAFLWDFMGVILSQWLKPNSW